MRIGQVFHQQFHQKVSVATAMKSARKIHVIIMIMIDFLKRLSPGGAGGLRTHISVNRLMLLIGCLKYIYPLRKYFIEFFFLNFGAYHHFDPLEDAAQKNEHPRTAYDPNFYFRILFHYKNGDVCKKTDLNILRFDRDVRVLRWGKIFTKFSKKNCLRTIVNQPDFKIFLNFFLCLVKS